MNRQLALVYSLIVAGKSARFAEVAVIRLTREAKTIELIDWARRVDDAEIDRTVRAARTGNYAKLARALRALSLIDIDLATCSPGQLEAIPGIGPKTSRFFITWTRPEEIYAVLDVHILRWMRSLGYDAPKSTPSGDRYRRLEVAFVDEARKRGKTPRELDSEIWGAAQRRVPEVGEVEQLYTSSTGPV